jgi:2-dehydropantoate 2-reductase
MEAIAPAVSKNTWVLPILNGLRHYAPLDERFGAQRVVGGLCFISAMKGADGEVRHLGQPASMTFGERLGDVDSERTRAFAALCARANIDHVRSLRIAREQWTKFTFLATLAAATCLMRAPVGRIVAAQGGDAFVRTLYAECLAVARAEGEPIDEAAQSTALATLTAPGSPLKASMLRDLEAGQAVEAMQIVGDIVLRARAAGMEAPMMTSAWVHLQAYEAGRTA